MADTSPVQLVDADGEFCIAKIDEFAGTSGLLSSGLKYQIVAIMGPQSSGKSTLMNHVFGTRFQEMDAESGRRQTTRGIWMAKAPEYSEVLTMLLDLEGTDGRERGEDDTTFERQSALFALAVSDVVVINIWCHDIGREHGSGKPLIKTVLQVNLKLFTPSPNQKKTVLVFAIRDKSKTPLAKLAEVLEQDMLRIWDSIIKPPEYQETSFHDFFEVYFEGMSNFEEKEEDFDKESKLLKKKFTLEGPETYVRLDGKLPGDAIPLSTSKVWEVIKSHRDLDLPAHKIMVATTRCSQIQHEQLEGLVNDGCFEALLKDAAEKLHEDFGERMSSLVDSCITGYDEDTMYFDADIRAEKRGELVEKVTNLVKGPYEQQMKFLHEMLFQQMQKDLQVATTVDGKGFSQSASECKTTAEKQFIEKQKLLQISNIELESSAFLTAFVSAIDQLIEKLKTEKMNDIKSQVEKLFETVLSSPAVDLFDAIPANLWSQVGQLLTSALTSAGNLKQKELTGYDLSSQERDSLDKALKEMALNLMKVRAKEAANTVLSRMKDKFSNDFSLDEHQMPRTWSAKDNIAKISKHARLMAADVLAQLTVFQAEGPLPSAVKIEQAIRDMAQKEFEPSSSNSGPSKNAAIDVNVAVEWPGIGADLVLIQPAVVRSSWRHFMSDTKMQITQASMTQHANKLASNRMPPIWAIFAMMFLGFDEFMAVVYSPILALSLIILLLFIRSLYIELDVDNEMQKGALPGAVSLAGKFIPSVRSVSSKTLESALQFFNQAPTEHAAAANHPPAAPAPVDDSQETMGLRRRRPMLDGDGEQSSGTSPSNPESTKDK